jgi:crotonobetainyl-CoA:carnitine CoA-transferase CaiB-like acyl-CoA transferase
MGPLDGTRVVDLSRYLSGPAATMLLGDMGADVVKVEGLPRGDPARESGAVVGGETVYYMASNRNKRSLAVDLRSDRGREICQKLITEADVVVENFRPGVADQMGLGWQDCSVLNGRLVYCSINGFGSAGVGATLPGFDQTVQAMSGLMSVTGTLETGPLRVGIAVADSVTGVFAAFGVVAALVKRERTGRGALVNTSLMGSMLSLMSYQAQRYLSAGQVPGQDGNDHPIMFPQGTFRTKDGAITIACGNEDMWRKLCRALSIEELADDPRFSSNAARMQSRRELRRIIEAELSVAESSQWLRAVREAGVPCGPVLNLAEALEHPVTAELRMIGTIKHSLLGDMKVLGRPVEVVGADELNGGTGKDDKWLRLPPPLLGEHSVEICREVGYTEEEVSSMLEDGIIRQPASG